MTECNSVGTPLESGVNGWDFSGDGEAVNIKLYQKAVGSAMYLMTCTRPDLAFAIGLLAQSSANPKVQH